MIKRIQVDVASGRGVADRWRAQYERPDGWLKTVSGDSKEVYNKLCDLGPSPDIAKVAEIIGNKGWSYINCDGCGEYVERAADYGSEYDKTIKLCQLCLDDGLKALTSK